MIDQMLQWWLLVISRQQTAQMVMPLDNYFANTNVVTASKAEVTGFKAVVLMVKMGSWI